MEYMVLDTDYILVLMPTNYIKSENDSEENNIKHT